MQEMLIATLDDLRALAERVFAELGEGSTTKSTATVLALHGELGAGKTAFTQALAQLFGVANPVTSPTFVIMRLYQITMHGFFIKLVHIDAYRIESLDEMETIGFADLVRDPTNVICVEWADKIAAAIPADAFHITFTQSDIPEDGALRKAVYGYRNMNEEENPDAHPDEN